MSVTWWQPVMVTGPKGWTWIEVGNLTGAAVWCDRCQCHTNHNGTWHRRYLEK